MLEEIYYDSLKRRLVYCLQRASPDFWDVHWNTSNFEGDLKRSKNWFVVKVTQQFLKPGSKVIDGGCGLGDKVYSLSQAGFDTYGVDFALDTVSLINKHNPELKIFPSDIRELPFKSNFFDGYWSLGVIEHFYDGYDSIASEMARVLRPGGYLFLTFPYMSLIRRLKSRLSRYQKLPELFDIEKDAFYQFALNMENVIERVRRFRFDPVFKIRMGGVKGVKDEIPLLKPFLKRLLLNTNPSMKAVRLLFNILLSPFGGHSVLLILRYSKN